MLAVNGWLNYFVYYIIKISQFVHNDEEVPLGDDIDQGKAAGDQASYIVPNHPIVGSQATPTNSVGFQAAPMMLKDPKNPILLIGINGRIDATHSTSALYKPS